MTRFQLVACEPVEDRRAAMGREVRAHLTARPRAVPSKYFYDEVGSRLFDVICDLPEYYLTRAEHALLVEHAAGIAARTGATTLVEIGSGMARKTGLVVGALCARAGDALYVPFDISRDAIEASARTLLAGHPALRVHGVIGDFARDLPRLATAAPPSLGPRLFAFLGSTIGNLDEQAAPAFIRSIAQLMTERDRFLLGVDLVKDPQVLHAAYNDSAGVTAEFNRNIVRVIARELAGELDADAFAHVAFYDPVRERIEMHLEATRAQRVVLRAIDLAFDLAPGERVMTEISRKFTRASVERTLAGGGMRLEAWLADDQFALALATRA
ncbi:MAG: L-histidine N(alpha)-methyltransferase [Acidobacteriota bacterium]